jgi:light-regulated signal transduction histidine kinase (bacteriophytochrome)
MVEALVADEGEGIPEELRDRVFDPFVTTKPRGLGLGLALAHRIVEEHRGALGSAARRARARPSPVTCRRPRRAARDERGAVSGRRGVSSPTTSRGCAGSSTGSSGRRGT